MTLEHPVSRRRGKREDMRVITFSRQFPKGHPKEGQPTYFVEKMLMGLLKSKRFSIGKCCELAREYGLPETHPMYYIDSLRTFECAPKFHTIRAGNRWKAGDVYSPRVWSGKPYASKQIEFAPPIKIEKVWDIMIRIEPSRAMITNIDGKEQNAVVLAKLAKNDGFELYDFANWFNLHLKNKEQVFAGQILCHNSEINY